MKKKIQDLVAGDIIGTEFGRKKVISTRNEYNPILRRTEVKIFLSDGIHSYGLEEWEIETFETTKP